MNEWRYLSQCGGGEHHSHIMLCHHGEAHWRMFPGHHHSQPSHPHPKSVRTVCCRLVGQATSLSVCLSVCPLIRSLPSLNHDQHWPMPHQHSKMDGWTAHAAHFIRRPLVCPLVCPWGWPISSRLPSQNHHCGFEAANVDCMPPTDVPHAGASVLLDVIDDDISRTREQDSRRMVFEQSRYLL